MPRRSPRCGNTTGHLGLRSTFCGGLGACATDQPDLVDASTINGADTAWMMTSTALVLLMTLPGIALFYGGMVRRKSVLNVTACVVVICAIVGSLLTGVFASKTISGSESSLLMQFIVPVR